MKEKLQWAKEHKKELLIGAGCFVGATALTIVGVKCTRKNGVFQFNDTSVWEDVPALKIKDLGNVGQDFLERVPEATEETLVRGLLWIEEKDL